MFRSFRSPDIFPPRQMAANQLIWLVLIATCGLDLTIVNFAELHIVIAYLPVFISLSFVRLFRLPTVLLRMKKRCFCLARQ